MTDKYFNGISTNPINLPINVKGIIIAIILKTIDDKYTCLEALLSIIGVLDVRIK